MADTEKTYKFPKTIGACVDRYYTLEQTKTPHNQALKEIDKELTALEAHIIDTFPKQDLEGAYGKLAKAAVVHRRVPKADDWDALYVYIAKTKSWDLLQKRLNNTACRDRWEDNKVIPGISVFDAVTLSVTKRN